MKNQTRIFDFGIRPRRFLAAFLLLGIPIFAAAQETPGWLMLRMESADSVLAADPGEKDRLVKAGWKLDGEIHFLPPAQAGAKPLHRMARPATDGTDRMLSANADEVAASREEGFADEGVLGFVALTQTDPGMVPVFRYRKGKKNLWLVDASDKPWAEKNGWKLDGPSFWVLPAATKPAGAH